MNTVYKKIPRIYLLAVIFYVWHTTIPIIGYYTPAVLYACIIVYLYMSTLTHVNNPIKIIVSILPILSIHILSLLYFNSSNIIIQIYQILQVGLYPLIFMYISKTGDVKSYKILFWAVACSYTLTALTTYIGCVTYPGAARDLAMPEEMIGSDVYSLYKKANIGNLSFTYSLLFIIPLLIYMVKSRICRRIESVSMLIIVSISILKTEYTTALLLMVLCFILFFLPNKLNIGSLISIVALMLVIFLLAKPFIGELLLHASSHFESSSSTISVRLYDLGILLSNDLNAVNGGDIWSRYELYNQSIQEFFHSPLWGGSNNVGGHSLLFDSLGRFGLIGLVALILMYKKVFSLFFSPYSNNPYYGYMLFSFLIVIILAVLNPKDNLGVITFTIPLFALYFKTHYESTLDRK